MALIADILLGAGALGAAAYCLVLSNRLKRFTGLEDGVGGAIAVLSAQVDDMTRALKEARAAAHSSEAALAAQTLRAEQATERLSLMLASLHDLPDPAAQRAAGAAPAVARYAPSGPTGGFVPAPAAETALGIFQPEGAPVSLEPGAGVIADDPQPLPQALAGAEEERRPRFLRRRSAAPPREMPPQAPVAEAAE
jgi:hypothetical protein